MRYGQEMDLTKHYFQLQSATKYFPKNSNLELIKINLEEAGSWVEDSQ